MKIAVDATCWHNRRGYGRHARALLRQLIRHDSGNQYTLFVDCEKDSEPFPEGAEVRLVRSSAPAVEAASANGRRSLADMARMSRALSAPEFSVVLFPTIYSFVPVFTRARKLVMVHDVIVESFPELTVPRFSSRLFWKLKSAIGRLQADALITVSDYSRDAIVRHFGLKPDRVFVVGEASDPVFRRLESPALSAKLVSAGIQPPARIVAYLGGFSPHKNIEALVESFAGIASRPEFSDALLVMVGDNSGDAFHTCFGKISEIVRRSRLEKRTIFTGYLDDADVVALLNMARVLVLPSLMEGFGLPAVEAAACGCPVIATRRSPLPRLLEGAGMFVDSCPAEIGRALEHILSSDEAASRMGARGLEAASRLTWANAARQMMDVISQVAPA